MSKDNIIRIIGAGLAGSEAAWTIAQRGGLVELYEMRPHKMTAAHKTAHCAELVCSNSLRGADPMKNAVGLLHEELRLADSLIMRIADENRVPAGVALAVDRENFSQAISRALENHPNIKLIRSEVTDLTNPLWHNVIIASGPLTSDNLASAISALTRESPLSFYDAIAPVIYKESINMDICWYQSRYDKAGPAGSGKDYINCPLDKDSYYNFIDALLAAEAKELQDFEKRAYFEGCLPIEIMASRGKDSLRHGPMKPRGLTNQHQPSIKPYAVVQLRQDNAQATLYNMVGFQTKLKHQEQIAIFRTIAGLEQAQFARLGGIHRNSFINSPRLLDSYLRLKTKPNLRFAGQITGCEGYVESTAIGWLAGIFALYDNLGKHIKLPPTTSAMGALLNYITSPYHLSKEKAQKSSFQPMNINFGLLPPAALTGESSQPTMGRAKNNRQLQAMRALADIKSWLADL